MRTKRIILTYSNATTLRSHNISGHTFEVFEYYFVLKKLGFDVKLLLAGGDSVNQLDIILQKYNVSIDNNDIIGQTIKRILNFKDDIVIIFDGSVSFVAEYGNILYADVLILLSCGKDLVLTEQQYHKLSKTCKHIYVLQDSRLNYPTNTPATYLDYKKKFAFEYFAKLNTVQKDTAIIYATKNCRMLSKEQLNNISERYSQYKLLFISENQLYDFPTLRPPIDKFHERFDTYIYTPTSKKWDCSPRLITECAYYGKQVIYHNIDYLDIDLGLEWRIHDIIHDFKSLELTENDFLIELLKDL